VDKLQRIIEEKIRQGFDEGAFDNLPGKGQPLKLDDENPFEDPAMRMGYRLLRNNGFTLPWIQEQKEIAAEAERLRVELGRAWAQAERTRTAGGDRWQAELRWRKSATTFRQHVAELNERIRRYNFQTPSDRFHRLPLDAEREIARIARPLTRAEMGLSETDTAPPANNMGARPRARLSRLKKLWRRLCAILTKRLLLRTAGNADKFAYN
jgi:Domain of unknown function (DUF1992)